MSSNLHRNKARDTSSMFSPCLNESNKSHMTLASIIAMLVWVWRNSVWTCSLEPPAAKRLQIFPHWSCPDINDRHEGSIFCVAPGCYSVLKALTEIITVIIFEITHLTGRQFFNNELFLLNSFEKHPLLSHLGVSACCCNPKWIINDPSSLLRSISDPDFADLGVPPPLPCRYTLLIYGSFSTYFTL